MKVAVIGGNGQLGRDVSSAFSHEGHSVTSLTHQDIEVSSPASVRESLGALRPELVVNTSALHHVEKCEADPAHAFAVNGIGARNLAQISLEMGVTLCRSAEITCSMVAKPLLTLKNMCRLH